MADTAINVTSSNLYKQIGSGNLIKENEGAANSVKSFNRRVSPGSFEGKDVKTDNAVENESNPYEEKSSEFNEQFSATQADQDSEIDNPLGWGAKIEHEDIESLQETTNKLANQFISDYSGSGSKIKDPALAEDLSKMMLTLSWKSEADPELLRKTQNSAYRVVSTVLEDMPRAGLDADLKASIVGLFNPATSADPNLKAKKLLNFIKDAGPEELAKKNSKIYKKIEKAFNLKVGNEVFSDSNGNTLGQQVVGLVKMYVDPIIMNVKDSEAEAETFDEKGQKALRGIREQILDAAIGQARDNKNIMNKLSKEIEVSFGNEKITLGRMENGQTSFKEYAEERLDLIKDYYLDPNADNKEKLIKHYARFSSEMADVTQKAKLSEISLDLLKKVSRNRKFKNIVLIPPELIKKEDAKQSLEFLFDQKINTIKNLEAIKQDRSNESISGAEIKAAIADIESDVKVRGQSSKLASLGNSIKIEDLEALKQVPDASSFNDASDLKAKKLVNKNNITVDSSLQDELVKYIKVKREKEINTTIRSEKEALMKLAADKAGSAARVDVSGMKDALSTSMLFNISQKEIILNAINQVDSTVSSQAPSSFKAALEVELKKSQGPAFGSHTINEALKLIDNTNVSMNGRFSSQDLDSMSITDLEKEKANISALSDDEALKSIQNTGTYTYKVIGKGDDISKLKQQVMDLSRIHNRELSHLKSVKKNMNKLIQDNFTRGGIHAVSKSVAHAFETSLFEDDQFTGDGLVHLKDQADPLAKRHNSFVQAMKMRGTYLESQRADSFKEISSSGSGTFVGTNDIKEQVAKVLNVPVSDKADAYRKLIAQVENAYTSTGASNKRFQIKEDVKEAIEKPNYKDPAAIEKQELYAKQILLNYMEGVNNLTTQAYNQNPDLKETATRISDLGMNKSDVAGKNKRLANSINEVNREFEKNIEAVAQEWMPDGIGEAAGLDSLIKEEQDLSNSTAGGKGFIAAGINFVETLLSDFVDTISGGRKDAREEYLNGEFGFNNTFSNALEEAADISIAETIREFMSTGRNSLTREK